MRSFTEDNGTTRVVFGRGTMDRVGDEVARLGRTALVLSTPEQADLAARVAEVLGERHAGTFSEATMHTPTDVTDRALVALQESGADVVVSVGGGSTTGLGKALALRTDVPQVVLPTTYAGSEVTPVLGQTADGEKVTESSPAILPETVIYDVDLTLTLPWAMSLTSGVNAMAHAVEALYSPDATPETDQMALDAIGALGTALPALREDVGDVDARADLLYGAWLAGRCLAAVGMGLHHKLCHTLGGSFDLPHAPTHTVVLPYAMEYNAAAVPDVMARVATALRADDAPTAVQHLVVSLDGPSSLETLGFAEGDIERATELATARPYPNPRPVTPEGIRDLLTRALHGDRIERPTS